MKTLLIDDVKRGIVESIAFIAVFSQNKDVYLINVGLCCDDESFSFLSYEIGIC